MRRPAAGDVGRSRRSVPYINDAGLVRLTTESPPRQGSTRSDGTPGPILGTEWRAKSPHEGKASLPRHCGQRWGDGVKQVEACHARLRLLQLGNEKSGISWGPSPETETAHTLAERRSRWGLRFGASPDGGSPLIVPQQPPRLGSKRRRRTVGLARELFIDMEATAIKFLALLG